jgi:hypothetical protein
MFPFLKTGIIILCTHNSGKCLVFKMLLNNLHKIGIKYVLPVIKYSFIKLSNNDQLFSFTGPIINTETCSRHCTGKNRYFNCLFC